MYYGPREGIHGPCIHTLLTLTRGHSTTVRDVTGNPCARSIWSLCSLYSLDALVLTPSSRSTGTACAKFESWVRNLVSKTEFLKNWAAARTKVPLKLGTAYRLDMDSNHVNARSSMIWI